MIQTRFTHRFGLQHPIANAPMALIAGGALTAAVQNAGGLGLLGGGYAGTLGAEPDLSVAFSQARGCGIGFIGWAVAKNPSVLDWAIERQPACLFFSFETPEPMIRAVQDAGIAVIQQVQRLDQAKQALDLGVDVIVAQGTEAGGHGGARATMSFLPEVADLLADRAPQALLLGAGGIADGRGLAAALALGADGVVMGSRFWAAQEALTPQAMVDLAIDSSGDDTVRSRLLDVLRGVLWPEPYSFRVLKNALTESWIGREADARLGELKAEYDAARASGDLTVVGTVVGEATGLIHDRPPASEILSRTTAEAEKRSVELRQQIV